MLFGGTTVVIWKMNVQGQKGKKETDGGGPQPVKNAGPKDPALGCSLRGLQCSFPLRQSARVTKKFQITNHND